MAIAEIKETCAGPILLINGIEVRSWIGTMHNNAAHELAKELNKSFRSE